MDHKLSFTERIPPAPEAPCTFVTKVEPNVRLEHWRKGALIDVREFHNLVTNAGKQAVATRINSGGAALSFSYVAIGTGTTPAAATDTALQIEIASGGGQRKEDATRSLTTSTITNDTAVIDVAFTFTSAFAVTESGLFNDPSAGTMLARQKFAELNVGDGDQLTVTWKIIVG